MKKPAVPDATGTLCLKPAGSFAYRAYSWSGRLLYVGVTNDLCQRMAQHRSRSLWRPNAANLEWEEWPDRASALRRESELIVTLRPSENIHMNGDPAERYADAR